MIRTHKKLVGVDDALSATQTLIERENAPSARFSLLESMFVERGTRADWELLHDLHYKAENLPIGPRFWKLTLEGETIGVLVSGVPKGMLRERHLVFPHIKPGSGETRLTNTQRYVYINRHFRVISRFVVDTMYRGIGAGYRMMNLVSRMEGVTYMEIQSSMSKFNLFGQKAGFRFVKPMNSNTYDKGLKFFRKHFDSSPQDFEALVNEINAKSPEQKEALMEVCRHFYYKNSSLEQTGSSRKLKDSGDSRGEERVAAMNERAIVKALQQVILASPMYGVWKNPDPGKTIPDRLPLSAFDWQSPTDPFGARLSKSELERLVEKAKTL